jgi:hypothetical protein
MVIGLQECITLHAKPTNYYFLSNPQKGFGSIRLLRFILVLKVILSTPLLQSCAAPVVAAASSAGTAAGSAAAAYPVTAVSVGSTVTTGRSPLEHAVSAATKKDCSFFNVFSAKPICEEVVIPSVTDKSELIIGEADRNTTVIEVIEVRPSN